MYATLQHGYKYAKAFASAFFNPALRSGADEHIEFAPGDIFFGVDLQPTVQRLHESQFREMRRSGVIVKFFIHDLLPVNMPQFFPAGSKEGISSWLEVTAGSDGVICNSKATREDYLDWLHGYAPQQVKAFGVDYVHLGSDLHSAEELHARESPSAQPGALSAEGITFLMVGTIEPRKGHAETLDAFDLAWNKGIDVTLVLVGKKGWMYENFERRLLNHSQLGTRLHWLQDADDWELANAYKNSHCFIAASYGEGFGIPIVEAAERGLPIIARDIKVFREIAGENAFYFEGIGNRSLPQTLLKWIELYKAGRQPKSTGIELLSWQQSAANIFAKLH